MKSPSALTLAHVHAFVDVSSPSVTKRSVKRCHGARTHEVDHRAERSRGIGGGDGQQVPEAAPVGADGGRVVRRQCRRAVLSRLIEHGLSVAGRLSATAHRRPRSPGILARPRATSHSRTQHPRRRSHRERASLELDEVEVAITVETEDRTPPRGTAGSSRPRGTSTLVTAVTSPVAAWCGPTHPMARPITDLDRWTSMKVRTFVSRGDGSPVTGDGVQFRCGPRTRRWCRSRRLQQRDIRASPMTSDSSGIWERRCAGRQGQRYKYHIVPAVGPVVRQGRPSRVPVRAGAAHGIDRVGPRLRVA